MDVIVTEITDMVPVEPCTENDILEYTPEDYSDALGDPDINLWEGWVLQNIEINRKEVPPEFWHKDIGYIISFIIRDPADHHNEFKTSILNSLPFADYTKQILWFSFVTNPMKLLNEDIEVRIHYNIIRFTLTDYGIFNIELERV